MPYYNDSLLEEIRSNIDIVDLISEYVELKKSGSNYMGLCPFHSEKTPSFSVSPSKEIFKCFGCGEGGDGISFIMKKNNLEFSEALKFLAEKYNISYESYYSSEDSKTKELKERIYEANKLAALFYMKSLSKTKFALSYLQSRGISINVIRKFGLGFADGQSQSLINYLEEKGFTKDELVEYNLASYSDKTKSYFDRFRNRIMFPIIDMKSRVIAFGGRVLDDSFPKYLNSSETLVFHKGRNLFGLNIVSKESNKERLILVEGYMDVIGLYKHGINYSVASLGTALTKEQTKVMKRYGKEIYICYDADTAGINATLRAIDIMLSEDIKPMIIELPDSLDPDDYIEKHGPIMFESLVKNAKNYIDFKIDNIKRNFNINTSQGLTGFIVNVADILNKIKSPVEQDIYIEEVSNTYGITRESLIKEMTIKSKKTNKIGPVSNRVKSVPSMNKSGVFTAQEILLRYAMEDIDCFNYIKNKKVEKDFPNSLVEKVFLGIELFYEYGGGKTLTEFLDDYVKENNIEESFISNIKNIHIDVIHSRKIINELFKTLDVGYWESKRKEILKMINDVDRKLNKDSSDITNMQNLILQLTEINNHINPTSIKEENQ